MASNKEVAENNRFLSIKSMAERYDLDKNIGEIAESMSLSDTPIILVIGDKKTNKEAFIARMEKKTIFDSKIFDIFDSRKIKIINCGESEKAQICGIIPLATSITVLFDISNVFNSRTWEIIYDIKENEYKEGLAVILQIKKEISSQDIEQITDGIRNTLAERGFPDVPVFIDSNETDETGDLKKIIKKRAKDRKIDSVKAVDDLKTAIGNEIMNVYDFTKEKYDINRTIKSDISEKDNDISAMISKKKTEASSSFSMIYESISGGLNSRAYTREYAKRESFEKIFDESKKSLNDKIKYEYNHFIDDMNEIYRHTQEKIIRVMTNGEIASKKEIHDGGYDELTNNAMNMVKSKVGGLCDKSAVIDKYTSQRYPEIEKINKKIARRKRLFCFFPFLVLIAAVVGIYCFSYFYSGEQTAAPESNIAAENTKTEKTGEQTTADRLTDTVKTTVKAEFIDNVTEFVEKVFVDINTAINTVLTFAQGFILIFIVIIVIIIVLYILYIKSVVHICNKKRDKLYEKRTAEFEKELLNNFFTDLSAECEKDYRSFYNEYDSAFMAKDAGLFEKVGIGTIIDEMLTELEEI